MLRQHEKNSSFHFTPKNTLKSETKENFTLFYSFFVLPYARSLSHHIIRRNRVQKYEKWVLSFFTFSRFDSPKSSCVCLCLRKINNPTSQPTNLLTGEKLQKICFDTDPSITLRRTMREKGVTSDLHR